MTVNDFALLPTLLKHVSVYVADDAGVTLTEPLVALLPDQAPDAAQVTVDDALPLMLHPSDDEPPLDTVPGFALKVTTGATGTGVGEPAVTVMTVTVLAVVPIAFVQEST